MRAAYFLKKMECAARFPDQVIENQMLMED